MNIRKFKITEFGALGDGLKLNTKVIQQAIDAVAAEGGGTVVIPRGIFLSGALFFKPGVNLQLMEGAVLLGSDNIQDYPFLPSRIEGVSQNYYSALVNAESCDNFSLFGKGTIDGNGKKYWQAFWDRREQNPDCTNLEVARPRLLYIAYSKHIKLDGLKLVNSGFWTTHLYQCQNIKITNLTIFSPREPLRAPSTDGIDLDFCRDVHIDNCRISVNDDAIAIKGGKGIDADKDDNNGPVENVLIENCHFGWNHAVLTIGSEAIACRNIQMRNCEIDGAWILFRCKLRPDTPQDFQNISLENIKGHAHTFIMIKDWTQFFDDSGADSSPISRVAQLSFEAIKFSCKYFRVIEYTDNVELSDICFRDVELDIEFPDQWSNQPTSTIEEKNLKLNIKSYLGNQGEIYEL